MRHYEEADLEQYLAGQMPWLSRLFCRWHLAHCPVCQASLKQLQANNQLLQQLRHAMQSLEVPDNPQTLKRLTQTFQNRPPDAPPKH